MAYRPFKVDGVEIPTPSSYKAGIEDLSSDATGRTLDAVMHKDIIDVKDYYEMTWDELNWAELAHLLNLIDGKSSFQFTHADPKQPDKYVTGAYYVGARSTEAFDLSTSKWRNISFKFAQI